MLLGLKGGLTTTKIQQNFTTYRIQIDMWTKVHNVLLVSKQIFQVEYLITGQILKHKLY